MPRTLIATLVPLILAAAPAVGQVIVPGDGDGCFICDDWRSTGGVWWHKDYQLFYNDMQGDLHVQDEIGSCYQHDEYETGDPPQEINEASDDLLLKVLLENDNAHLNVERSALQIRGEGDMIMVHVPLTRKQLELLQDALGGADADEGHSQAPIEFLLAASAPFIRQSRRQRMDWVR